MAVSQWRAAGDAMIVALKEMVEHVPTVCELADLPSGDLRNHECGRVFTAAQFIFWGRLFAAALRGCVPSPGHEAGAARHCGFGNRSSGSWPSTILTLSH